MVRGFIVVISLAAAGGGGYLAGTNGITFDLAALDSWSAERQPTVTEVGTGRIIYYRNPDGKPEYAARPKKTADGRDFVAVHASEDVRFDTSAKPEPKQGTASATNRRKVLYYRNPMGLPDTSPVPKKDSMGMDYIPVFEGDDQDAGIVKISPGKLQRTGVKSV